MAREPFSWISESARPRVLLALAILVAALSAWLSALGGPLVTAEAPHGIVSFELARTGARSGAILASWPPRAREAAMLLQGLDFLYLLVYPAFFSLAAALLGARLGGGWARVGRVVAWAVLAAIPLDSAENLALVAQLQNGPAEGLARLAWTCAIPKFALVAGGAGFLAAGGAAWLARRVRRT